MKVLLTTMSILLTFNTFAVSKSTKNEVQGSMINYVNNLIESNGFFPVIHEGKVLKLKLEKTSKYPTGFHSGIQKQGQLYASCADFTDKKGNKYDVDFLVSKNSSGFDVVQPIVHSINGNKSKYDLAH